MEIKLNKLNNKLCYYRREKSNEDFTNILDDFLKINKCVNEEGEGEDKKVTITYDHRLQCDSNYVYIPITLIDYIKLNTNWSGFELDSSEIDLSPINLDVDSAEEFLNSVYGEHSDKICSLLRVVSENKFGLINLYTGWGKTWAILGLAYLYLSSNSDKRVCILAQGSAVVNEIRSRIPLFKLDESRIVLENTASVRSHRFYEDWWKEIGSSIDLVLIDECDSIPTTLMNFLNNLPNYRYIFGFTATPDYFGGQSLNDYVNLDFIKPQIYRIIQYVGLEIVNEVPDADINLVVINSHFSDKKVYMKSKFKKFKDAVLYVIDSDKFIRILEYISKESKDTVYLPVNNRNLIYKIMDRAKKIKSELGFIYWDAQSIWSTTGESFSNHIELRKWLESVDKSSRPNIILSTRTSYRAISIPSLTDIIFVENSNYRSVIQSVGRTMRSNFPTIWVPRETDRDRNLLFFAMATKRLKIINKSYPNLHIKRLDM